MPSTVKVNMRTCGKTSMVTAELQDDGETVKIKIESNCPHVQEYAQKLTEVRTEDVIDFGTSKVESMEYRSMLSVPCMVPNAVFNASWMELGLLSKTRAEQVKTNDNEFIPEK